MATNCSVPVVHDIPETLAPHKMETVPVQIEATPEKSASVDPEHECVPLTFVVDLNIDDSDATAKHVVKQTDSAPLALAAIDQIGESKPCILEAASDDASRLTVQVEHSGADDRADSITTPTDVECPPGLLEPPLSELSNTLLASKSEDTLPASYREDGCPAIPADISCVNPAAPTEDLSLFSLDGVRPLESFIPDSLLPDDLLIHDPNNITQAEAHSQLASGPPSVVRYVRLYPKSSRDHPDATNAYVSRDPSAPVRIAHLYLKGRNGMGWGHHSVVYRAPLELCLNPNSTQSSRVSVAVKVADDACGAHCMLRNEADIYNAFPRHLMEDVGPSPTSCLPKSPSTNKESIMSVVGAEESSPSNVPPQDQADPADVPAEPAPYSELESTDKELADCQSDSAGTESDGGEDTCVPEASSDCTSVDPGPAVVPKFFGYYVPLEADGTLCHRVHKGCDEDSRCYVTWPTGILLMEECGKDIGSPSDWSHNQRVDCFNLYCRLGDAGFVQASPYTRNMLVQPGPLSVPPERRSLEQPSFRIIDFGRGESLSLLERRGSSRARYFDGWVSDDQERAERALWL
ncbi:hypothetical protein C8Q79DRAFT_1006101 [Trametes meyenii]|nr:hypothetical protein C8Q79DRAFT_1006101 [Trametes meyenii]